jgi:P-type conjugative transfer protein TrbJ
MTRRAKAAALLLAAGLALTPAGPAGALSVFDGANYSQNLLSAVRALEQINNQVRQLQNEAQMLIAMARHLERLDFDSLARLNRALAGLDQLVDQARGMAFEIAEVERAFATLYPERYDGSVGADELAAHARQRWQQVRHALDHTMRMQARVVQQARADRALIDALVAESQGAVGMLQAQQATNQLLGLQATQTAALQHMLAAQARAEALELAREVAAEERAREQRRRFLGDGRAYTPAPVTVFRNQEPLP